MNEPIAYLNGRFVPQSQATLSVTDLGVVAGASVTEMARTFRHELFQLAPHLERLEHSLSAIEINLPLNRDELTALCQHVVRENAKLIPADHDLGLVIFVTAGQNLTYLGRAGLAAAKTPTVCVHTFPLPFELWADKYASGLHLITTSIKCPDDDVIPASIKHRNRLHWILADQQVKKQDPAAMAIMTDSDGYLTETATGNICVVEGTTIVTPEQHILRGVSRHVVADLATSLGMSFAYGRVTPDDLSRSKEAFLTSTPHCLLPITRFNGREIGDGRPGPVFQSLIEAWSRLVNVDIINQMTRGALARTSQA